MTDSTDVYVWVCPTCGSTVTYTARLITPPICTAQHRRRDENRLMIPLRSTGGDAA